MEHQLLQVGESYILPVNTKILVKEMGVTTKYTMLLTGSFSIIYGKIKDMPTTRYNLLLKMIDDVIPFSGNKVNVDVKKTALILSVNKQTVYKSLIDLMQCELIYREKRCVYRMNPAVVWSGRTNDRGEALLQWERWHGRAAL
jgi:hypothetical protein